VAGTCEHSNEPLGSIKSGKFFSWVSKYSFPKMNQRLIKPIYSDRHVVVCLFGATAPSGPGPPHSQGF